MSDEVVPPKEAVNRLVNAFRKELDSYVQQLDEQEGGISRASRSAATAAGGRYGENAGVRSSKRVVVDDTATRRGGDNGEPLPPPPIQTPFRDDAPPLATRAAATATPFPMNFSAATWKANMNEIADIIESSEERVSTLQRENEQLEQKVRVLTRDYAVLQEDYQQMQTRKVKALTDENEALKDLAEELRAAALEDKQAAQAELTELRAHLREARTERDTVERQNDRLYDRIRDYEQRFGTLGMSPVRPRQASTSSYQQDTRAGSSSYRPRSAASPGESLVRDLSEKTSLDPDYLAPLSDILDRRLGRTPAPKHSASSRTTTPASRNLYS